MSRCRNVIKAKTCLDAIGSECPQEAKDKSKKSITIGADQCAEIGQFSIVIYVFLLHTHYTHARTHARTHSCMHARISILSS